MSAPSQQLLHVLEVASADQRVLPLALLLPRAALDQVPRRGRPVAPAAQDLPRPAEPEALLRSP